MTNFSELLKCGLVEKWRYPVAFWCADELEAYLAQRNQLLAGLLEAAVEMRKNHEDTDQEALMWDEAVAAALAELEKLR